MEVLPDSVRIHMMTLYSYAVNMIEDRLLPAAYATAGMLAGGVLAGLEAYQEFLEPNMPDMSRVPLIKYFQVKLGPSGYCEGVPFKVLLFKSDPRKESNVGLLYTQGWVPHDLVNRLEHTLTRRPPGLEENDKPLPENEELAAEYVRSSGEDKASTDKAAAEKATTNGPAPAAAATPPHLEEKAAEIVPPQVNGTATKQETQAAAAPEEITLPLSTKGGKSEENGHLAATPDSSEDFSTADEDVTPHASSPAEERTSAVTVESNGVQKVPMKEVSKPKTSMSEASQARKKKNGSRKAG